MSNTNLSKGEYNSIFDKALFIIDAEINSAKQNNKPKLSTFLIASRSRMLADKESLFWELKQSSVHPDPYRILMKYLLITFNDITEPSRLVTAVKSVPILVKSIISK